MLVPERYRHRWLSAHSLIGFLLILSFILNLGSSINLKLSLNSYGYTEFLINFQGGFVRRGLFGEILFQLYKLLHFPINIPLIILCYTILIFVLVFFFKKFYQEKYSWWLLLSPLFLGFTGNVIRKDYLLYFILICILYLMKNDSRETTNRIGASLLICLGLFLHEAFIFFGYPLYALLLISDKKHRCLSTLLALIPILLFLVLSVCKGNPEVAHTIVNSWNGESLHPILKETWDNSIGALGWTLDYTVNYHIKANFLRDNYSGIVFIPLISFLAYYMFTNFIFVFKKTDKSYEKPYLSISLLYSTALICLIPMLTILSCDMGRVFQYATIAAFSGFLIISPTRVIEAFPKRYRRFICNVNKKIFQYMRPNKGGMLLLLLFMGVAPYSFSLSLCWKQSVMGEITNALINLGRFVKFIVLS